MIRIGLNLICARKTRMRCPLFRLWRENDEWRFVFIPGSSPVASPRVRAHAIPRWLPLGRGGPAWKDALNQTQPIDGASLRHNALCPQRVGGRSGVEVVSDLNKFLPLFTTGGDSTVPYTICSTLYCVCVCVVHKYTNNRYSSGSGLEFLLKGNPNLAIFGGAVPGKKDIQAATHTGVSLCVAHSVNLGLICCAPLDPVGWADVQVF